MWPQSRRRQAHLSWLPAYAKQTPPPHAVAAELNIYVIRGRINDDVIPGKWPVHLDSFEVLCNTQLKPTEHLYGWVSHTGGNVPDNALYAGETQSSEPLYIARRVVNNEMCVGKVHPSHGCAYFPWGGEEHSENSYEVLCFLD
ncbi:hypothetical protein Smp_003610.1 [Schistosoma mansoni]|uniref:hypothetical protein n=1 Tax=Schistosoma mansoni TaxID=6183 RepID=UPI0001A63F72|nr:hypothetical protein Smp_003610.1 [Schistosoma mansoni]|eukprot:XP_018647660.1 hypothetical protein Smp_003610.1 [Schistosoma mansoni]